MKCSTANCKNICERSPCHKWCLGMSVQRGASGGEGLCNDSNDPAFLQAVRRQLNVVCISIKFGVGDLTPRFFVLVGADRWRPVPPTPHILHSSQGAKHTLAAIVVVGDRETYGTRKSDTPGGPEADGTQKNNTSGDLETDGTRKSDTRVTLKQSGPEKTTPLCHFSETRFQYLHV